MAHFTNFADLKSLKSKQIRNSKFSIRKEKEIEKKKKAPGYRFGPAAKMAQRPTRAPLPQPLRPSLLWR
jgi:hypothetical protein